MQHFHRISMLYSSQFIAKSVESLWWTFLSEINEAYLCSRRLKYCYLFIDCCKWYEYQIFSEVVVKVRAKSRQNNEKATVLQIGDYVNFHQISPQGQSNARSHVTFTMFFFNFDVHGSLSISKTQCVYTYYKESNLQWQENIAVELLLLNANRVKAMQMA